MPKVSVLIPIHNRADMPRTSLQSVLRQGFDDFEVLVSGDGVVDDSERVALETTDPRLRWFGFPKAPGYGYANRARTRAQAGGELVAYISPDDLWAPDHLERLVACLTRQRWPLGRRAAGWLTDFARVARLKGPAFARTWAARRLRRRA